MSGLVIGIDIDGVLANFNDAYRIRLAEVTGRALIPEGEEPPCWYYATDHYGYTKEEDKATWKSIVEDANFWYDLQPYAGTKNFLIALEHFEFHHAEKYFITTRPGLNVKRQSERWLTKNGWWDEPTVLIARGEKGPLAAGLGVTHFIDDRPENCFSVQDACPNARIVLLSARYNQWAHEECKARNIAVIDTIQTFLEELKPCPVSTK